MKRIQLFEFEDFCWFPSWLRTCMTNLIVVLYKMMGISEVLAALIAQVLATRGLSPIVDLGSGSGGPMPRMYSQKDVEEMLNGLGTDNYKWDKGIAKKKKGKQLGTYVLGLPRD